MKDLETGLVRSTFSVICQSNDGPVVLQITGDIKNAAADYYFTSDSRHLLYASSADEDNPMTNAVFKRDIQAWTAGVSTTKDVCLYEEKDPAFTLELSTTSSAEYVMIRSYSQSTSECLLVPQASVANEAGLDVDKPILVVPRSSGVSYWCDHKDNILFVSTNADGAINYRVEASELKITPGPSPCVDLTSLHAVLPHRNYVQVESIALVNDVLVVTERR
jgi:oligopeptidase B